MKFVNRRTFTESINVHFIFFTERFFTKKFVFLKKALLIFALYYQNKGPILKYNAMKVKQILCLFFMIISGRNGHCINSIAACSDKNTRCETSLKPFDNGRQ